MAKEEWVDGKKVRHEHLFQEGYGDTPEGPIGNEHASLIHTHPPSDTKHLHPLIEAWDEFVGRDGQTVHQTYYLYGPDVDLPEAVITWPPSDY